MAVALERHQLVDLHGAVLDDAADVVAGQVDQHDVLGALLGVLGQLGGELAVVLVGAPRKRVPAIGREITVPSSSCTIGSGEQPDQGQLVLAHVVHVRARVDLAQHAVDVERVGSRSKSKRWASTTWKMSPARMCSLATSTAASYMPAAIDDDRAARRRARAARHERLVERRRAVGRHLRRCARRPRRSAASSSSSLASRPRRRSTTSVTCWLQWSYAASSPMTDRIGVGPDPVVGGDVGQVLDLAHDVVAEVADHAGVQRRQLVPAEPRSARHGAR